MENLEEHPQIAELLETLEQNGLTKEKSEVQSLVGYIGSMEQTLTGMLGELQNMRNEINLIHNSSLRSKCQNLVQKTDDKIRHGFSVVKKMKDNLIRSARNAMKAFREKGKDALAESVRAIKIPETLDKLSLMFRKMSADMAQDSMKLSAMQSELQGAKGHLKNMGLLLVGRAAKETAHIKTDKGIFARLSHLFDKVQKGFFSLEQKAMDTADKLRVTRVKVSVKESLNRYKEVAKNERQAEGQTLSPQPKITEKPKER